MKTSKKVLSVMLAVLMIVSVVPFGASAAEQWWMPLTSYVSVGDPFGCTCDIHRGNHKGQDFPAYGGTTVRASKSGTVVAVVTYCKGSHYNGSCSCGSSWGNYVKIKHADGFYSLYAHLSSVSVSNGQSVSQGQKVGGVGTTGDSTGNHLHFEIYNTSNTRVNPMNYVNPNNPSPNGTHSHSYDTHYEGDHPHRDYNKCSCGDWYYTGTTHDTYSWHYEADHPHRAYKTCWCGDWHYTGETVYVSTCSTCNHKCSYSSTITTQPSCTKEGVRTYKCSCGASYTEAIAKTSHNSNTTIPAVAATCTKTGLTQGKKCSVCGTVTVGQTTINATGHKDNNFDGKCDSCGVSSGTPDTPSDSTENCSCNCHKGGIIGLIFKILLFFNKLFGQNKICACGVAHY